MMWGSWWKGDPAGTVVQILVTSGLSAPTSHRSGRPFVLLNRHQTKALPQAQAGDEEVRALVVPLQATDRDTGNWADPLLPDP